MSTIVITSTRPEEHGNYDRWLRRLAPGVDLRYCTSEADVDDALPDAGGLLLPGGGDPDPVLYGKPEAAALCSIDAERDALELRAIRVAVERGLPMLGICRGLQIMNVALGGTLIADLPSSGYDEHHRLTGEDRVHDVHIEPGSMLHGITGEGLAWVNSAHHQGIDAVAPRLAVTARSADGLPEALEWRQPAGKPFLLCVHWHPERLPDTHPLADPIGRAFLSALSEYPVPIPISNRGAQQRRCGRFLPPNSFPQESRSLSTPRASRMRCLSPISLGGSDSALRSCERAASSSSISISVFASSTLGMICRGMFRTQARSSRCEVSRLASGRPPYTTSSISFSAQFSEATSRFHIPSTSMAG